MTWEACCHRQRDRIPGDSDMRESSILYATSCLINVHELAKSFVCGDCRVGKRGVCEIMATGKREMVGPPPNFSRSVRVNHFVNLSEVSFAVISISTQSPFGLDNRLLHTIRSPPAL